MSLPQSETPDYVLNCGPVCEKLWQSVHGLLESANQLKNALIHRQREQIWELLSEHQRQATALEQASSLWHELQFPQKAEKDPEINRARQDIIRKMKNLQIADKVNKSLISNYLKLIEKSFIQAGAGIAGKKKVYDRAGKLGLKKNSLMLNIKG